MPLRTLLTAALAAEEILPSEFPFIQTREGTTSVVPLRMLLTGALAAEEILPSEFPFMHKGENWHESGLLKLSKWM